MNPNDVYKEFLEAGTEWADKHGAAELLDNSMKSLKAHLAMKAKEEFSCSMAEAETRALDNDEYREAIKFAAEARTKANRARVRYDATKALFEARRTAEASERAAMRSAT